MALSKPPRTYKDLKDQPYDTLMKLAEEYTNVNDKEIRPVVEFCLKLKGPNAISDIFETTGVPQNVADNYFTKLEDIEKLTDDTKRKEMLKDKAICTIIIESFLREFYFEFMDLIKKRKK